MTVMGSEQRRAAQVLFPSEKDFLRLASQYDIVTLSRTLDADLETPVGLFMKLARPDHAFLLESAERGEHWGRYSFIGCEPLQVIRYQKGKLIFDVGGGGETAGADPIDFLFDSMASLRACPSPAELPFSGGAVGFFSYDLLPFIDDFRLDSRDGPDLPDMMFMFTRTLAAFDHLLARIILMANVPIPRETDAPALKGLYLRAAASLDRMSKALARPVADLPRDIQRFSDENDFEGVSCNRTREGYQEMVRIAKEYIYAGDVFQVVPSQRFCLPLGCPGFSVYRSLRSENPSPYMFYIRFGALELIGSSPEPMVAKRGDRAIISPIAGTRPRGRDGREDRLLEEELRSDPKERAEHVMLVDLARNDLGRVCLPGSVKVTRMMEVERFSHVMHLVSEVEGRLRPGRGPRDLIRSSFPAGTVSGAPKIRACQIIDELEGEKRGPYAGAVGYISYQGDMDTCIAIRTIVCHEGMAYVQVGAGIVADSDPGAEYEETRNKARAMLRAIRISQAREGLK
jgi:anthranilate synthase component 1